MIKKLFILCTLGLTVLTSTAQVVPNLDWVNYYSGTTTPSLVNISNALDASNNVYVTGYIHNGTNKDLKVLKYDSLGTLLWSASYDNGADDMGNAITFDASGNVYVTGVSYGTGTTLNDYVTIMYNSSGTAQWTKRYNATSGNDEAMDIKTDASGNVYVTGSCYNGLTNLLDIGTIKYSGSGGLVWASFYDGASNNDFGTALVLESNGNNVFVAGNHGMGTGGSDIVALSLSASSGNANWTFTVSGTGTNSIDESNAIILSGANIVLCGVINNTITNNDYTTIKVDGTTGAQIFKSDYDFGSVANYATALVRDSTGNIAVTGRATNGSYFEYHTLLYDSTGTQKWVNKESTLSGSGIVSPKIACDTIAHHFYVCGEKYNATNDIFVYQITPGGNTSWKKSFNAIGNSFDYAKDMSVNGIGEIHITALCTNTASGYDITTLKISQTPDYSPVDTLNEAPNDLYAFTTNNGQLIDESAVSVTDIQYYTENTTPYFFFKNNQMSFIYARYDTIAATEDTLHKVNVNFYRSNDNAEIFTQDQLQGAKNYFIPQFPSGGITDVKSYRRLFIPNIYPYIDLHYYSNADGIKYYFVVKPGGNPALIKHEFIGASSTGTITGGDLQLSTTIGTLNLERAYPYQVAYVGGTYSIVPVTFTANWVNVATNMYAFNTGTYNLALPLVFEVDQGNTVISNAPNVNIDWNTFAGGNRADGFYDMGEDVHGNMYAFGRTNSQTYWTAPTYSTVAPLDLTNGVSLYKFNKWGIRKKHTYIGCSGGIVGSALTVLKDSSVVLVGSYAVTTPTIVNPAGSYSTTQGNSYILKFVTDLNIVQWSTRYPGDLSDVDANSSNDIYVLGIAPKTGTNSVYLYNKPNAINIGTVNINHSYGANVISRFTQTGVANWSSYLPLYATGYLKVDKKRNNYYVFGSLNDTTDFKHFNNYSTFLTNTLQSSSDAFIQKYTSYDTLIVSTLYGGNNSENLHEMEILKNGDACLVGYTQSTDSVKVTYNPNNGSYFNFTAPTAGNKVGWITKFDSIMQRKWAITYGTSNKTTTFFSVCKDNKNSIFIGGSSSGMPLLNLIGAYNSGLGSGVSNPTFLMFDSLSQIKWATFMGSSLYSGAITGAVRYNLTNNNFWFSGYTNQGSGWGGYPFVDAIPSITYYQPQLASFGYDDGFIGRFNMNGIITNIETKKINESAKGLFIYPNPSNNFVTINTDIKLSKPYLIRFYNSLGQVVYSEIVKEASKASHTINLFFLTNGIYFINLSSGEINKTAKLIKE